MMRLSRQFGCPFWRAFRNQLTRQEYLEWQALEILEPTGEERADLRTGMLALAVESMLREKPMLEIEDFMPFSTPAKVERTNGWEPVELQVGKLLALAAQWSAKE